MTEQTFDSKLALAPSRSVVVEACAGSGKTWLLVSRMLRLQLAGAAPQERRRVPAMTGGCPGTGLITVEFRHTSSKEHVHGP